MTRYYLHMTDGQDMLPDSYGVELAPEALAACCKQTARQAIDAGSGDEDWNGWRVEACDESRAVVLSMPFPTA